MTAENRVAGRCLCGAVRFLVSLPVKFCVHCHCPYCRHMHGAAFVTWLGVRRENFGVAGKEHLKWYVCSPSAKRGFCDTCGTPLLFLSTRWPDDVHVTRASIIAKVDITPRAHIHYDKHVEWFPFEDSLAHLGGDEGVTPLKSEVRTLARRAT